MNKRSIFIFVSFSITSFFLGYIFLSFFFAKDQIVVPSLIGKSLSEGMELLADCNLSMQLASEVESHLAPGTILEQTPRAQKKIRPRSPIFVVVAKRAPVPIAPYYYGMHEDDIVLAASQTGVAVRVVRIPSSHSAGSCIAQDPQPHAAMSSSDVVVYISQGSSTLGVIPSFKELAALEVEKELISKGYGVALVHRMHVGEDPHSCSACIVVEQRPLAGSIVDLSKKLYFQLLVEERVSE